MGLYFNKPDTVKLCAKLNRRFSDQNLTDIRSDPDRLAKFQNPTTNTRSLQRIAYKSGLWPTKDPTTNKAKRWFKFLKDINDGSAAITLKIKQALCDGLTKQTAGVYDYSQLVFTAIEGPVLSFTNSDIAITNNAGNTVGKAMLLCLQTPVIGAAQLPPPTTADPGEDPANEPDDPDDSDVDGGAAVVRRAPRRAKKKAAKKKAAKKRYR